MHSRIHKFKVSKTITISCIVTTKEENEVIDYNDFEKRIQQRYHNDEVFRKQFSIFNYDNYYLIINKFDNYPMSYFRFHNSTTQASIAYVI